MMAHLLEGRCTTQVGMRQPAPGAAFPVTHVTRERGAQGPSTIEFMLEQDWTRSMNVVIAEKGVTVDGEPRRYEVVGDVMQIHGPLVTVEPLQECYEIAKAAAQLGVHPSELEALKAQIDRNHASRGPVTMEELKAELAKLPRRAEPPRRLDIRQDKPAFYTQFDVYLDGVKQSRAVVADADKGYLERYLPNPAPWLTRFARRTERKSGTVVIVWRDDPLPGA